MRTLIIISWLVLPATCVLHTVQLPRPHQPLFPPFPHTHTRTHTHSNLQEHKSFCTFNKATFDDVYDEDVARLSSSSPSLPLLLLFPSPSSLPFPPILLLLLPSVASHDDDKCQKVVSLLKSFACRPKRHAKLRQSERQRQQEWQRERERKRRCWA